VAHMLIPHYQGAIKAAYQMDAGTPSTAKADGAEHWKVIDAVLTTAPFSFAASDRAQLGTMFLSPAASGKVNFCTAQTLLLRNLPGGSNLQYGGQETYTPGDGDAQHVTAKDVGVLKVSMVNGEAKDCSVRAMPPPSPPPAKVKVGATVVLTLTASGSVSDYSDTSSLQQKMATAAGVDKSRVTIVVTAASVIITATIAVPAGTTAAAVQTLLSSTLGTAATASASLGITVESAPAMTATEVFKVASAEKNVDSSDSGLSEGEIAGVAIGGAVGGIVLLGVVGLILRSILFKEAKPVFTCLEKSTAKSPA